MLKSSRTLFSSVVSTPWMCRPVRTDDWPTLFVTYSGFRFKQFVESLLTGLGGYYIVLFTMMFMVLATGTLLESVPNTIILAPILAPIAKDIGVDPFHFAVIFLIGDAIGFITPPYGLNLYVASGITGLPYLRIVWQVLPFLLSLLQARADLQDVIVPGKLIHGLQGLEQRDGQRVAGRPQFQDVAVFQVGHGPGEKAGHAAAKYRAELWRSHEIAAGAKFLQRARVVTKARFIQRALPEPIQRDGSFGLD